MDAGADPNDRSVEAVFRDFKGRRAGIIRALTTELDEFYQKCDPEKENLCLYGYPTEQWEVNVPVEEVPPEIPEPVLGINFSRDGMPEKDWLLMVAAHSDTWLVSAAFYFGARFGFDRASRKRLFNFINDLPTISETVVAFMKKQNKEKSSVEQRGSNNKNNKSKPGLKRSSDNNNNNNKYIESANSENEEDEEDVMEEDDEEQENTVCGKCNEYYSTDEFWICCDICETWFHGKCVKISQSKAAHIKQYKCPSCSKKPRH